MDVTTVEGLAVTARAVPGRLEPFHAASRADTGRTLGSEA